MNIKRAFLQILPGKSLDENFLIGKKACIGAKEKGYFVILKKTEFDGGKGIEFNI